MEDLRLYNPERSDLRIAQHLIQDILDVVTDLFDKNKIPYWLSYGTALGAARHEGFIPWDDDADISVPNKYKKKVQVVLKEQLPDNMIIHYPDNDPNYKFPYIKVRNKCSIIHEPGTENYKYRGLFIDIFFSIPTSFFTHQQRYNLTYKQNLLFRRYFESRNSLILNKLFFIDKQLLLLSLIDRFLIKRYFYIESFEYLIDSKKDIFPLSKICFEQKEYSSPKNISAYLDANYEDYQRIPPENERIRHAKKYDFLPSYYNNKDK